MVAMRFITGRKPRGYFGFVSLAGIVLLSGLLGLVAPEDASAEPREILIAHTNNVNGYLFPCPT
jgi:hypothetical protein